MKQKMLTIVPVKKFYTIMIKKKNLKYLIDLEKHMVPHPG